MERVKGPGSRGMAALWLLIGIVVLGLTTVPGLGAINLDALATPPVLVRAFLAAAAVIGGLAMLRRALLQIEVTSSLERSSGGDGASHLTTAELAGMVRGIRYVFLAAAAFAAASGWLIGDPLPLVIALVIAGVDLAETSFLLLVALGRGRGVPD